MIRLVAMFLLTLVIAVIVVSVVFLPWWGAGLVILALVAALFVSVPWLIRWSIRQFMIRMMDVKSRVLRNAKAIVHEVKTVAPLRDDQDEDLQDDDGDEEAEPRPSQWYVVDVTIEPRPSQGPMHLWEPGDLSLVAHDVEVSLAAVEDLEEMPNGYGVEQVRIVTADGGEDEDEQGKYEGLQRVRLWFKIPLAAPRHLKFVYYWEGFGDVRLPEAVGAAADSVPESASPS